MNKAEFDHFAEQYQQIHSKNIAVSGEEPSYFSEYKIKDLCRELGGQGKIDSPQILDFGAGVGNSIPFVTALLPNARLICADVSHKSLQIGKARFGHLATQVGFDGETLPFARGTFDSVLCACVFHHIDESEHISLLREMRRVLKPGGFVFMYEHNPYNPLTLQAVNDCPFDENAKLIRPSVMKARFVDAGFHHPVVKFRVFFPSKLRSLRFLEAYLQWCPIGAQYFIRADA